MGKNANNQLTRFSNRVSNYIKYRPGYPIDIIDFLKSTLNLNTSDIIADIGSGTGIFSELFLKNGDTVFGIEPNKEMRHAAEDILKKYENFHSIGAAAENTTLENSCIDFITCAQSFHWFDREQVRKEFIRILKENGWVILIWNSRDDDASEFMFSFEKFINKFSVDYQNVNHKNIDKHIFDSFFKKYNLKVFHNHQDLNLEGLKGRLLSASYVPTEEDPRSKLMINDLEKLFKKFEDHGVVKMIYNTEMYFGKLS